MSCLPNGLCPHYDCDNRTDIGYCKTTMCINPRYSKIGTAQYGQGVQNRVITNADRIRAMTDEELAEFLDYVTAVRIPWCADRKCPEEDICVNCTLEWLKKECEE